MLRRLAMTSDNGAWGITDSRACRLSGRWLLLSLLVVWNLQQVRAQLQAVLPTVTLLFNSSSATVVEGSVLNVQLIAQGTYNESFDVNLIFTEGVTVQPVDCGPVFNYSSPATVSFDAGAVSSSVLPVMAVPNNAFDPVQRRFQVTFKLPVVAGVRFGFGGPSTRTLGVTVVDDDSVKVAFQAPFLMVEEDVGAVKLQLQAEGPYCGSFRVPFACVPVIPTEAKGGVDFEGGVYTVTFNTSGVQESASSIASVTIHNDSICELKEAFICVILRPRGVDGIIVSDPKNVSVQILDDDPSSISFMTDSITLSEKNGSNVATLRLAASHEFQNEQIVQVAAIDDLLDSSEFKCCAKTRGARDYNLSSAFNTSSRTVKVRFPRNSRFSDPFRVHIVDDDEEENWEKFYLNLTIPAKAAECGAFLGENRTLETLVKDDDGVRVGFKITSISETGAEGTTVILKIYRHGRMRKHTEILIATEHITTTRKDFKAKKGSVTFKKTSSQSEIVKFKIKLTNDGKVEGKESFVVRLTRANRRNVRFDRRCAVVTIMDPPTTTLPTTDP